MIFLTYSWENEKPDDRVLAFVNFLRENGFEAICDIMLLQEETAISFPKMMANCLNKAEKVIIVLSEKYKTKADSFIGGVGEEYQYIITDITTNKNKYVLLSFENLTNDVISKIVPDFIKGREVVDLVVDKNDNYSKLFSKLNNQKEYNFSDVNPNKVKVSSKGIKNFTQDVMKKQEDIDSFDDSTPFFDYRVGKAFPGVRGLKIYDDPEEALKRLSILLRNPLKSKSLHDPIWYFRGHSCLYILHYKELTKTRFLIGVNEIEIDKIAVYKSNSYFRDFVYVQAKADKPIGIYPPQDNMYIQSICNSMGYYNEEYGLYQGNPISRAEYDDGAAEINGKIIDLEDKAELRVRYLTPYNFVICAKFHPFNTNEGDNFTRYYLDEILKYNMSIEQFTIDSEKLNKHRNDY